MRFFNATIKALFLSTFLFLTAFATIAYAQLPIGDFVQIESSNKYPRAFENLTIKLTSYSTDLNKANITWFVNKKQEARGTGLTSHSVQTGKLGTSLTVDATIRTAEGLSLTETIILTPTDIDLMWETDSTIPPFYKGRPLLTPQGDLKVVAIPNFIDSRGNRIDPKTLVYTWKVNFKVLGNESGYGRQKLSIRRGVTADEMVVGVTVTGLNTNLQGTASISLNATQPEVLFYEESPLYGVLYNQATPSVFRLTNSEVKLVSVPYFFSNKTAGALEYNWSINNLERDDLKNSTSITLKPKEGSEGSSVISLQIKNLRDIFQEAVSTVNVNFSNSGTNPLF